MTFQRTCLALLLFILVPSCALRADWHRVSLNPVGGITAFAGGDSTYYASIFSSGLFKSTDKGRHWHTMRYPIGTFGPIVVKDSFVVVGSYDGKIFRSSDRGRTWSFVFTGSDTVSGYISPVNFLSYHDSLLYAGFQHDLEISSDNGATWHPSPTAGQVLNGVNWLAAAGSNLFVGTGIGGRYGSPADLYRSADKGATWTRITGSGLPTRGTGKFAAIGGTIFAATLTDGILRSTNAGETWTATNAGLSDTRSAVVVALDTLLLTITPSGIFSSVDTGAHWTLFNAGYNSSNASLFANGSFLCINTADGGRFFSDDKGASWIPTALEFLGTRINSVMLDNRAGNNVLIVATDQGTYSSGDNGASWTPYLFLPDPTIDIEVLASDGISFYAALGNGSILTHGYAGWTTVSTGADTAITKIVTTDTITYAASATGGIYKTTDHGGQWSMIRAPGAAKLTCFAVVGWQIGWRKDLYAGFDDKTFLRYDGQQWVGPVTGFGNANVTVYSYMAIRANRYAGTDHGMLLSWDDGATWQAANTGLPASPVRQIIPDFNRFDGSTVFGVTDAGLFYTWSTGEHWVNISANLPGSLITSVAANTVLFVGTRDQGLWTRPISEIPLGINDDGNLHQPREFSLYQNFPNPFNPSTTIRYTLPAESRVTLTVCNILGQTVATLVDQMQSAGTHQVVWEAASVPSGIYFYFVRAGGFSDVKKLVIAR